MHPRHLFRPHSTQISTHRQRRRFLQSALGPRSIAASLPHGRTVFVGSSRSAAIERMDGGGGGTPARAGRTEACANVQRRRRDIAENGRGFPVRRSADVGRGVRKAAVV